MITEEQKVLIGDLREDNKSYKVIADMLGTTKNTIKGYCNKHGLGGFKGEVIKVKEEEFKERLEKQQPNFIYHSGYTGSHDDFMCQCKVCGRVQKRNALCARLGLDGVYIQCENCIEITKVKKGEEKIYERLHRDRSVRYHPIVTCLWCRKVVITRGPAQKYCNDDCYRESQKNHNEYTKQCDECGAEFKTLHNGNRYCSIRCRRRKFGRHRNISRDVRLRRNGKIDYSITLDKLIKRDRNICHICGEICNTTDYKRVDSYFIARESYSSIDHLLPVSRGGTHTWDNIKLAHRRCNNNKLNHLFHGVIGKQITMSI